MDANGVFNATDFDGLYTYTHSQIHNRPQWKVLHTSNDKNIYYDGTRWVINGICDGFLYYAANTQYPPLDDTTSEWLHSIKSGIFHVNIHCISSYSPTAAPSTSPSLTPSHNPARFPSTEPLTSTQNANTSTTAISDVTSVMQQFASGENSGDYDNMWMFIAIIGFASFVIVLIILIITCIKLRNKAAPKGYVHGRAASMDAGVARETTELAPVDDGEDENDTGDAGRDLTSLNENDDLL